MRYLEILTGLLRRWRISGKERKNLNLSSKWEYVHKNTGNSYIYVIKWTQAFFTGLHAVHAFI